MTDWLPDLEDYAAFCANPDAHSDESGQQTLAATTGHGAFALEPLTLEAEPRPAA